MRPSSFACIWLAVIGRPPGAYTPVLPEKEVADALQHIHAIAGS